MPAGALMRQHVSDSRTLVIGAGATGWSVARFLDARGEVCELADDNPEAVSPASAVENGPGLAVRRLDASLLDGVSRLVVSPGVPADHPVLMEAAARGVAVTGDIALFMREARAPVVAITASNGKSTVTELLGEMARAAGRRVGVGGNLGTPALDLLADDRDLYVLELSSFQLEWVDQLDARAVTILNISPDHLDRYASFEDYAAAKKRIYRGAGTVVLNRQADFVDQADFANAASGKPKVVDFGLDVPAPGQYGLVEVDGTAWLAQGNRRLLPVAELAMAGRHNILNALAALALGEAVGLPRAPMLAQLRVFRGLPHRCQVIARRAGVIWVNDSKATNTGATIAALEGLSDGHRANLILIAGGQGKGQDFSPLARALPGKVRHLVLLGEAAMVIANAVGGELPVSQAVDMTEAVQLAAGIARDGDTVLLSPACASFDMFKGFADRGDSFVDAVEALC